MFEVIALGVGDTFSELHHTTALLLMSDGFSLAIDCPDSYRRVLRDTSAKSSRPISISDVDHVLITHVHGDHMNGLEGFAFFKRFAEGKRVHLLAAPEVRDSIWDERLKGPMGVLWDGHAHREMKFDDYFDYQPLSWTAETVVGPFRIRTRRTLHHVPTTALLIECEGRIFGYSSDTAFDPGLVDFLSEARLIIHETNLGPAHTPWTELESLPEPIRRRMRLIHYPDAFEESGCSIGLVREGDVLTV